MLATTVIASMGVATAAATAAPITGSGSTLVQPLMAQWTSHYSGGQVTYSGVGSGQGIVNVSNGVTNFGASDAPMTPQQHANCHGCIEIPWALTATAIGYNLHGVRGLRISGPVLAKIYLGQITKWNDPQIKKLNKRVNLPNEAITPVYRSDGSGDTYVATDFMSRVSSAFAHRIGNATAVSFPRGNGAKGNSGVAATILSTPGAIGYIAASYAITQPIQVAGLQNAAGNFEYPNLSNISAAARATSRVPANNELHIVNPSSVYAQAYPMSTYTYAIVPAGSSVGSSIASFIRYTISAGQKFGPALDFAPLPKAVQNADYKAAKKIH
ncbi:MAG TPA: phosphate ABC transporter substrate-binding protein PstS [Solirubrobacteraceae bacterium]|nr:phosphate ABC transporter substrate-binding protein PstS [Solirubrobacteraceae bacterium]